MTYSRSIECSGYGSRWQSYGVNSKHKSHVPGDSNEHVSHWTQGVLEKTAGSVAVAMLPQYLSLARADQARSAHSAGKVADVFLDLHRVHKWNSSHGDTWDARSLVSPPRR